MVHIPKSVPIWTPKTKHPLHPLSSQQSLKVVGFDDPLIARVPYDLYEARARDSVIRMDGSATRTPAVYAAGELWV